MVLGLDATAWTAIGTIALALTTAIYVILTNRLARAAQQSANAAERLLLIELAPVVHLAGLSGSSSRETAQIVLSLRNVGKSAALNIEAEFEGGAEPIELRPVLDVLQADGQPAPIGIQTSVQTFRSYVQDTPRQHKATIHYQDAMGNRYQYVRSEAHREGELSKVTVSLFRLVDGELKNLG